MIKIIAKLDEVLSHILNMNQDYTISIAIEKFDLYDFTKKSRQVFH
jgi:phenylpyruvate tautomerase PptA (4-oxalocrotonate tautomerase family)